MAADIAEGMYYLQCCSFVVGNFAARSVLVDRDYSCKIAGFGLERDVTDRSNTAVVIHEPWAAPELLPEENPEVRAAWRRSGDSGVELPPGAIIDVASAARSAAAGHRGAADGGAADDNDTGRRCFTQ